MWRAVYSSDGAVGAVEQGRQSNIFGRTVAPAEDSDIVDNPTAGFWFSTDQAHQLKVESDVPATDNPTGAGLHVVRIFGLRSWTEPEIYEDVPMGEVSENAFVAVNWIGKPSRLYTGPTTGVNGNNAGTITAKTDPGGVEVARILPLINTSQMACLAWPVDYRYYISAYYASINKATGRDVIADINLWINSEPEINANAFYQFHPRGMNENAPLEHRFNPYAMVDGPAVLKIRIDTSSAGADVSAGLQGYMKKFVLPVPPGPTVDQR